MMETQTCDGRVRVYFCVCGNRMHKSKIYIYIFRSSGVMGESVRQRVKTVAKVCDGGRIKRILMGFQFTKKG